MIMGNVNCYAKNAHMNNNTNIMAVFCKNKGNQQLQKVLNSNSKIATIEKKEDNEKPEDIINQKIENINFQLRASQESEEQIQNGMSILQEKEIGLDKIKGVGNELKELCKQYKNSNFSEKDKAEIEKQAGDLLNGLENLMNKTKIGENNIIQMKGSDGKTSIILSKSIDITLDLDKLDDTKLSKTGEADLFGDKHFESKVSAKTLLENTYIIQERILNPVQKAIEEVNGAKSIVYDKFIKEYSSATSSIDELFKSGGINAYVKGREMAGQQSIYNSVFALRFQSSNINKNNVAALLR